MGDGVAEVERFVAPSVGVGGGVGGVDAVDAALGHEQFDGADGDAELRGGGVGGDEGLAGAGDEQDDAVLFEVAAGASGDVGLGDGGGR